MSTTNVEKEYVHEVYEAIAPHFSETRYKVRVQTNWEIF